MPLDETAIAHWLSPTQIDTYQLCPRKWGWIKLDGIKAPSNKYAERGSAVHKVAENWLEKGQEVDTSNEYGKIFVPGIKFLPPPGSGVVEHKFTFKTSVAIYNGLWDLWLPVNDKNITKIYDHKTTSDFKWMLLSEDLKNNTQANIYSVAALAACSKLGFNVDEILLELNWVYYRASAKKPGARRAQLCIIPDKKDSVVREAGIKPEYWGVMRQHELEERFIEIEKIAAEMLEHHRQKHKAMDLDYKIEGCNAYGGCPFKGTHCKLKIGEMIRGHMEQQTLAEKMKASKASQQTTPDAAAAAAEDSVAQRMKAGIAAKPAQTEADPAVVDKVAEQAEAAAVNAGDAKSPALVPPSAPWERVSIASEQAAGIIAARLYNHTDPGYTSNVGNLAVEVADEIIKAAAK